MDLTENKKRFLRSKAHHLDPNFSVGKNGLNKKALLYQIGEALKKRN